MSSQEIQDYITKQVSINNDIVTYRTLSRAFFINVNIAKNELVKYRASVEGETSTATYLLSGDLKPPQYLYDDEDTMDIDEHGLSYNQVADTEEDSEEPIRTAIILVSERDLEDQKSRFSHIHAQTIHCLSPSPVNDGNILCPLTETIRKVDNTQKGIDHAKAFGKVMTKGNKVKVPKPLAKLPVVPKPGFKAPAKTQIEESRREGKEKTKEKKQIVKTEKPTEKTKIAPTEKSKPTGKLDFSKAKTKEMKEKEREEKKADTMKAKAAAGKETKSRAPKEEKEAPKFTFFGAGAASTSKASVDVSETKVHKEVKEEPKRGVKRKSASLVKPEPESSDDEPSTGQVVRHRIVKGAIMSDDEDADIPPLRRGLRKSRVSSVASSVPDSEPPSGSEGDAGNSEAERDLKAMMDIDDNEVDRATHEALKEEEEEEEEAPFDDDVAMSDSDVPKPKPRARKPKKVVPVGSNGLKKKRVMKTEKTVDNKGYMIAREYSDYESVDEAEPPPIKKGRSKAKPKEDTDDETATKSKATSKPQPSDASRDDGPTKKEPPAVKKAPSRKGLKPSGGSKGKTQQKSLMTFFGPPK